jgi:hypothetical protein
LDHFQDFLDEHIGADLLRKRSAVEQYAMPEHMHGAGRYIVKIDKVPVLAERK